MARADTVYVEEYVQGMTAGDIDELRPIAAIPEWQTVVDKGKKSGADALTAIKVAVITNRSTVPPGRILSDNDSVIHFVTLVNPILLAN